MVSQDFLFYSLGIGFLILVVFFSYVAYHLAKCLKTLAVILHNVADISNDIDKIENAIKFGMLSLSHLFLKKGGEKENDKRQK